MDLLPATEHNIMVHQVRGGTEPIHGASQSGGSGARLVHIIITDVVVKAPQMECACRGQSML